MGQAGRGQACCDDNMQLVTLSAQASSQLKTLYDIILIVRLYNIYIYISCKTGGHSSAVGHKIYTLKSTKHCASQKSAHSRLRHP